MTSKPPMEKEITLEDILKELDEDIEYNRGELREIRKGGLANSYVSGMTYGALDQALKIKAQLLKLKSITTKSNT